MKPAVRKATFFHDKVIATFRVSWTRMFRIDGLAGSKSGGAGKRFVDETSELTNQRVKSRIASTLKILRAVIQRYLACYRPGRHPDQLILDCAYCSLVLTNLRAPTLKSLFVHPSAPQSFSTRAHKTRRLVFNSEQACPTRCSSRDTRIGTQSQQPRQRTILASIESRSR